MQGFYRGAQGRIHPPAKATMVALFFPWAYGEKERRIQRDTHLER
jgi:hypothetical protein